MTRRRFQKLIRNYAGMSAATSVVLFGLYTGKEKIGLAVHVPSILMDIVVWIAFLTMMLSVSLVISLTVVKIYSSITDVNIVEYKQRPAEIFELEHIRRIAVDLISPNVSNLTLMARWHAKNHNCFTIIRRNKIYSNGAIKSRICGYYCTIPISKRAFDDLVEGKLDGASFAPDDIASDVSQSYAVYIGGLGSYSGYGRGKTMAYLIATAGNHLRFDVKILVARGATDEGRSYLEHHSFEKLKDDDDKGALYVLSRDMVSERSLDRHANLVRFLE